MTPPINLYGYATSPYVRKTGAFLYYKQLPFTLVPVNPSDPENTLGKFGGTQVPVLEIGDEWRRESCLLYTSPSPRDATLSRMPSSA